MWPSKHKSLIWNILLLKQLQQRQFGYSFFSFFFSFFSSEAIKCVGQQWKNTHIVPNVCTKENKYSFRISAHWKSARYANKNRWMIAIWKVLGLFATRIPSLFGRTERKNSQKRTSPKKKKRKYWPASYQNTDSEQRTICLSIEM